MKQYLDLMKKVYTEGTEKTDRTGTGTVSVFGHQMRFNLQEGFPLVTTKTCHLRSIIHELLWFLNGETNIDYLKENKVRIWDEWRQPWTADREIVKVDRIVKSFEPYEGDFAYDHFSPLLDDTDKKLASIWESMMSQCYSKKETELSVCKEWHNLTHFIQSVKEIPHWRYKLADWDNFTLSVDYYGSNQYSPETCVWMHKDELVPYNWIQITKPNSETIIFDGYSHSSKSITDLSEAIQDFVVDGKSTDNTEFEGWKFEKVNCGDVLYRKKLIDKNDLGPVYGAQWRSWPASDGRHIDQITRVIEDLKHSPDSRRIIVSAWNVGEIDKMALAPCHAFFQFYVADGKLSCQLYQRSADIFLGVPFNIASYSLLVHMIAQQCDLEVGDFIWTGGDCHIYKNHFEQVETQLSRTPRAKPTLVIKRKPDSIFDYKFEDFEITGYDPHPTIKAPVAI